MVSATVREGCSDGTNAGAYESARLEKANILVEGRRESLQQHDYYHYPILYKGGIHMCQNFYVRRSAGDAGRYVFTYLSVHVHVTLKIDVGQLP